MVSEKNWNLSIHFPSYFAVILVVLAVPYSVILMVWSSLSYCDARRVLENLAGIHPINADAERPFFPSITPLAQNGCSFICVFVHSNLFGKHRGRFGKAVAANGVQESDRKPFTVQRSSSRGFLEECAELRAELEEARMKRSKSDFCFASQKSLL